jgi:hypothetical protein
MTVQTEQTAIVNPEMSRYTPRVEAESLRSMLLYGGVYTSVTITWNMFYGYHLIGRFTDEEGTEKAINIYPRDRPRFLAWAINPVG